MQAVSAATVEHHLPLIRTIARRVARGLPHHISIDELVGAGTIGLYDAAARFDPSHANGFESFAAFRIRGAMLDALRGMDWLSRRDRALVREGLLDDVGAAELEDDNRCAAPNDDPDRALAAREEQLELARALPALSERHRLVLSLYYVEELTLREIAATLEVSESRICQIHRAAIEELRKRMAVDQPTAAHTVRAHN